MTNFLPKTKNSQSAHGFLFKLEQCPGMVLKRQPRPSESFDKTKSKRKNYGQQIILATPKNAHERVIRGKGRVSCGDHFELERIGRLTQRHINKVRYTYITFI